MAAAASSCSRGGGEPPPLDPTVAPLHLRDGVVLGADPEKKTQLIWLRKVWEKRSGHRARALDIAKTYNHAVVITMQSPLWWIVGAARRQHSYNLPEHMNFVGSSTCATSFRTYDVFEGWHEETVRAGRAINGSFLPMHERLTSCCRSSVAAGLGARLLRDVESGGSLAANVRL